MSEKTLEQLCKESFGQALDEALYTRFIRTIAEDITYHYKQSDLKNLVTSDNIRTIWMNFSNLKVPITSALIDSSKCSWRSDKLFSDSEAKEHLLFFFSEIDSLSREDLDEDDNWQLLTLRINNATLVEPKINLLERFKDNLKDEPIAALWRSAALETSGDEETFEYFYNSIKHSKGSIDKKTEVLEKAFSKGIFPKEIAKKIAESSPITLRRLFADNLHEKITSNRRMRYYAVNHEKDSLDKEYDKLQELAMLFVAIDDSNVLHSLSECLDVKNLSWIVGNASKYPYIANKIMNRMNKTTTVNETYAWR